MVILAMMTSLLIAAFVSARDANRDSIHSLLACRQFQHKLWDDVSKKSGAARNEALRIYSYNVRACEPPAP